MLLVFCRYNRGEIYYWGLAAWEAYGYWEGDCYGCGVYVWFVSPSPSMHSNMHFYAMLM